MPIYEYQCLKCSQRFELIQWAGSREMKVECPKCKDTHVQRVISMFSCAGGKGEAPSDAAGCAPKPGRFT